MIPVVKNYDSNEREPIDAYLARWPESLSNFPTCVIENWVHRHNPQFMSCWTSLHPTEWSFSLREMSNEEIMSIEHLDGELDHWDYVGNKFLGTTDEHQFLARYIAEHGTTPSPIIVAVNAQGIRHPKGRPGELMKVPLQLIEGHRRIGFLREMNRQKWPSLKALHQVWALSFNA